MRRGRAPKHTFNRVRLKVLLGTICMVFAQVVQCDNTNRPPRFLIDGHSEIVLRLKEGPDTPVGSLIYRLRGSDPDNDPLTFGIKDTGYGSDILRIENDQGNNGANLYLTQELDREVTVTTVINLAFEVYRNICSIFLAHRPKMNTR